jgi:hypothetical protein
MALSLYDCIILLHEVSRSGFETCGKNISHHNYKYAVCGKRFTQKGN